MKCLRWMIGLFGLLLLITHAWIAQSRGKTAALAWLGFISRRSGNIELHVTTIEGGPVLPFSDFQGAVTAILFWEWSPTRPWMVIEAAYPQFSEILVVRFGHPHPINVSNHPAEDANPVWSPDGEWLAFVSKRHDVRQIYLVRPDGADLQRIAPSDFSQYYPTWSPDGQRLAFLTENGSPARNRLVVFNRDDGALTTIVADLRYIWDTPRWSPSGEWIAFSATDGNGISHIYRVHPDGSDLMTIGPAIARTGRPQWLPNNATVIFEVDQGAVGLYRVQSDGSDSRQIVATIPERYTWPADGAQLAYVIRDAGRMIYLQDLIGDNAAEVLVEGTNPQWSPDGEYILFSSDRESQVEVYGIRADGHNLKNLSRHPTRDYNPQWGPAIDLAWHPERGWVIGAILIGGIVGSMMWGLHQRRG